MKRAILITAALILSLYAACYGNEPGETHKARIVRWKDGDTVVVEIRRVVTIRIQDCWAAETGWRAKTTEEAQAGAWATLEAKKQFPPGTDCTAYFYYDKNGWYRTSLGRVVGDLRFGKQDIAEWLIQRGYAFPTKEQLRKSLPVIAPKP